MSKEPLQGNGMAAIPKRLLIYISCKRFPGEAKITKESKNPKSLTKTLRAPQKHIFVGGGEQVLLLPPGDTHV